MGASADALKRHANRQLRHVEAKYRFWPHLQARILPEVGPGATVGILKLGYPLLLYEDAVPTWLSLVTW